MTMVVAPAAPPSGLLGSGSDGIVIGPPLRAPPPGAWEGLQRLLHELCSRNLKEGADTAFRKHVEEEAREMPRLMDMLFDRISHLIDSPDTGDNLGALRAMDILIDIESSTRTTGFAKLLKRVFMQKQDFNVLLTASGVLGHLVRDGGPQTSDVAETQVKWALEWLKPQRVESRRLAAVLILKEMADHAPTVFNVHVHEFVDDIWVAIRDPSQIIRERAVEALRSCLTVIVSRETQWRIRWYFRMFEVTHEGLSKNASVESIHGFLLAFGELLRNTGEFMMSRFREISETVFKFRGHKDRLVRGSITALLPRIAHFLRDRFVTSYLKESMSHLEAVMLNPSEKASGFVALGELAGAVGSELRPYLPMVVGLLRDAIQPRRGKPAMKEAIACVGSLVDALGEAMEEHARNLLEPMFSTGLSQTLVDSLNQIASRLPSLLPTIQERLLDLISIVLCKVPYNSATKKGLGVARLHQSSHTEVLQALQTLTKFDFKGHDLLEFTKEAVAPYLEVTDGAVRREAAICCCRLVEHSSQSVIMARLSAPRMTRLYRKHRFAVEEIVNKLLTAAVADTNASVRECVLVSLQRYASFYDFLAQADCLRALFIAFNDEAFVVRKLSISMAGKLGDRNPAYVFPALRRHLQQLLTDLEHSAESKSREESAVLVGSLINACPSLVIPYIVPVHKAMVARLSEGTSGNVGVTTGVMATVGELARVARCGIRPYIGELMPFIVESLTDASAATKREVAVVTLGQLVQSTGYVITPYTEHPQLLGVLLRLLNGDLAWTTRREVLKVLGIMGALDPHIHKRNQLLLQAGDGSRPSLPDGVPTQSSEEIPTEMWPAGGLFATTEDYYSTVAINVLIRILRDPALSSYHQSVVSSLMYIFKVTGLASVPYLPKVMPDLLNLIRTCDEGLREYVFAELAGLVEVVKQHIRKYLKDILGLIAEFWASMLVTRSCPVLLLLEKLCGAFNDEFRSYMPEILPRCVHSLSEAERIGDYSYVPALLHTFEVFGAALDEHMHLVLPAVVRLFRPDVSDCPVDIRRFAIATFSRLIPYIQVSAHVSALLQPLLRVLDGTMDELRKDAVDAICVMAIFLGANFAMFVPSVQKLLAHHHLQHAKFDLIAERLKEPRPSFTDLQTAFLRPESSGSSSLPSSEYADGEQGGADGTTKKDDAFQVNETQLKAAWESSQRFTKEDWVEWMRRFSLQLLKESPSPALRTCAELAQSQPQVAKELFAVAFVNCWPKLNDSNQKQLVRNLNYALKNPNIPPEILATLLNLAEFMERDEKPLPVDTRTLGPLAEKCHLFAKALHYKEMEFDMVLESSQASAVQLVGAVEALIHVNNQLHQHEAAVGILTYAQQHLGVELKESWYEKLQRWEEALAAYTAKAQSAANQHVRLEATFGRMRCLVALARWEELSALCRESWAPSEPSARLQMAPMAACAAWNMGRWDDMTEYVSRLDDGDDLSVHSAGYVGGSGFTGAFYRAVLCTHDEKYEDAREYAERARKCLATELAALVLESYDRAYGNMIKVQQLSELEEVIDIKSVPIEARGADTRTPLILKMWRERIRGAKRNVEVWQNLLSVRTLVLPATEDTETWLKFASLCYKSGRVSQSRATLVELLQYDPEQSAPPEGYIVKPPVMLAYLKYLWSFGEESKRRETYRKLQELVAGLGPSAAALTASSASAASTVPLLSKIYLKLGTWNWALHPTLDDESIKEISAAFKSATDYARVWAKAWHKWALFNTAALTHYLRVDSNQAGHHVVAAVTGYFRSIAHASTNKGDDDSLQDILRLLTLWFNHGASQEVHTAMQDGFRHVDINTWLVVLPQIIARIHHSNVPAARELIQSLLVRIGQNHPQALMYPLLVACKSISSLRRNAAQNVVDKVRQHHGSLVDQAQLVSKELIRVAILWHEMWHEALEEASRLYFGERKVDAMLAVLDPLHAMLENEGPVTVKEIAFVQAYGKELQEAHECCVRYKRTSKEAELTQAWDLYYNVFKRIMRQLPNVKTLELQYVSPSLLNAKNLELAVPGTYRAGCPVVTIAGFASQLMVITSKQRPRKLTIYGSDGHEYAFLLKGHEDLRQDERVMQLFGLVNTLLANARHTAEKDLSIQRYDVIPLDPNSGLIGWVPNCDTLHQLIKEYRDARKIPVNAEHSLMTAFAPDLDNLTLIAKVEVFQHALENTAGDDLAKVFWLKSKTSEVWLDRRTNYTRSLAVMSMVGYLLGLGDRHPSNLMLNRYSGKILHIDFGDCFEASMTREKFPEKVPFRLTRMLVKAMEVSGIEGNFRSTCEDVMQVLRSNKDSVMAMMEAFVHDPLINWRLFNINEVPVRNINEGVPAASMANVRVQTATQSVEPTNGLPSPPQRGNRERELLQAFNAVGPGDANEVLFSLAVSVMARMSNKLTGRDFAREPASGSNVVALSVKDQVQKLIIQATSHENLCQSYVGWCPFW